MSQSSNDTFPTAMHIAALSAVRFSLLGAAEECIAVLRRLEAENEDVIKIGRTHLQDATPLRFSQEIRGWRGMLESTRDALALASDSLCDLALGGTAVGTGLNAPEGFAERAAEKIAALSGLAFRSDPNKFRALTSKDALVFTHGAVKSMAACMMKIANDVRWLASGPRCGIGEIRIPENEPGSSIMPGKVNPTQCESVTMVAVQVMADDAAIGFAASQGNFELNVFMPVIIYNFLHSTRLLSDSIRSFTARCLDGMKADRDRMKENLDRSLMLVTCLSPRIGYENAAKAARLAYAEGLSLRDAVLRLGYLDETEFDELVRPENMVYERRGQSPPRSFSAEWAHHSLHNIYYVNKKTGTAPFPSSLIYSRMMPASSHLRRVSSLQIEACTSPMWILPSRSIESLDWPMPPPIVSGSSPRSSIL